MADKDFKRKLNPILGADVGGYSHFIAALQLFKFRLLFHRYVHRD